MELWQVVGLMLVAYVFGVPLWPQGAQAAGVAAGWCYAQDRFDGTHELLLFCAG